MPHRRAAYTSPSSIDRECGPDACNEIARVMRPATYFGLSRPHQPPDHRPILAREVEREAHDLDPLTGNIEIGVADMIIPKQATALLFIYRGSLDSSFHKGLMVELLDQASSDWRPMQMKSTFIVCPDLRIISQGHTLCIVVALAQMTALVGSSASMFLSRTFPAFSRPQVPAIGQRHIEMTRAILIVVAVRVSSLEVLGISDTWGGTAAASSQLASPCSP